MGGTYGGTTWAEPYALGRGTMDSRVSLLGGSA